MKKKNYEQPKVMVVNLEGGSSILAGSNTRTSMPDYQNGCDIDFDEE